MPPSKTFRRHGAAPSNWQFRSGRPAWIPSPSLRKAGWKRHDFKAPTGGWMSEGASIDACRMLNAAVEAWRRGELVPAAWAHVAPAGAADAGGPYRPPLERFSIGRLVDAYQASDQFTAGLAAGTQRDYAGKLKRFQEILGGQLVALPRAGWADHPAIAEARACSVYALAPADEIREGEDPSPLHKVYRLLRKHAGDHQASGVLAVVSAWLDWCGEYKARSIINYARLVSRTTPKGRLRVASWAELQALVDAADRLDMPEIGDAIVLAVDLSWSQQDLLALTWDNLVNGRARKIRIKTRRMMETPLGALGLVRIEKIRQRQDNVRPLKVIDLQRERERQRRPDADSHFFRDAWREVRTAAAAKLPSLKTLNFQDLRDTAVTIAYEAELELQEIASRTGHSLKQIQNILDSHYGEISRGVADRGKEKLDRYMQGRTL